MNVPPFFNSTCIKHLDKGDPPCCNCQYSYSEHVFPCSHATYLKNHGIPRNHIACWHALSPKIQYTCQWNYYLQTHHIHKKLNYIITNSLALFKFLCDPLTGLWWVTWNGETYNLIGNPFLYMDIYSLCQGLCWCIHGHVLAFNWDYMVHKTNELPSNWRAHTMNAMTFSCGANLEIVNIDMGENTIKEVTMDVDND